MHAQPISNDVLREKYAKGDESTADDIFHRVARALASVESQPAEWEPRFLEALRSGFIPAGRVMSAAGTDIQATLINCFVQPVGDSISEPDSNGKPGIYVALREAAETMRRGGGVGYDFSRIRPKGAQVRGTASNASGPVSYMRVFDRSCETVESAGSRRGAQMGILRCDHPDIEEFIHAKDRSGELTNFNISVAVTDAFMRAVETDAAWELVHQAEPGPTQIAEDARRCEDGLWVYRTLKARNLWDQIMASTYDHAEPGVLFMDRANAENNLYYCEVFEATNPCVTADTWVMTDEGPRQVGNLIGQPFVAVVDGESHPTGPRGFYHTGTKPVVKLQTKEGYSLRLTEDHRLRKVTRLTRYVTETQWTPASELKPGDRLLIQNHRKFSGWAGRGTWGEGYALGLLMGDGHLKVNKALLAVWDNEMKVAANGDCIVSPSAKSMMETAQEVLMTLKHRSDFKGWFQVSPNSSQFRAGNIGLWHLALSFGMAHNAKRIAPVLEMASSDFCRGFLRGFFDTDGTVSGTQNKGVSVRLSQANLETLEAVQRMLLRLGIFSTIYRNRRPMGQKLMPDGRGGQAIYTTQALHELVIGKENLRHFEALIGFTHAGKAERLAKLNGAYNRSLNRERFIATVESMAPDGEEDVYDVEVQNVHEFDANGFHAHNCAEEFLPDYGCCCLGSIDLARLVTEPFSERAAFDFEKLAALAETAVRMLDNVLDLSFWPLDAQRSEAMAKRRVGLGFTGLGDALIMLGLRYDTDAARAMAARIAEALRDAAYRGSVALAQEKGAFPLFDAEKYLAAGFARRLPEDVREAIRTRGLRNSHLLAIAPTGTISLAFADNASNGIEPPFAWTYTRRKRTPDGGVLDYVVEDHAYRLYRTAGGDIARLPSHWITALDIAALDHMRMLAAVQPYIDTSISKTVNVPSDYPFEAFKDLYLEAWRNGLKGLATFRPNLITGAVLEAVEAPTVQAAEPDFDESDPNRRLRLERVPEPALASLRWRRRPRPVAGNPAWCYMVDHPHGSFAVFVGHLENGGKAPFEVWVNGAEQPRGLGALAKSLSMDLRSNDRGWLRAKLESLMKASGDDGFDLPMPPNGEPVRVPSLVSGFARLVYTRCTEIGAFEHITETPVLHALMSPKEPKTGPDGTLSWTVDILNPATGDDFVMGLKELVLPNGQRRPYSVWLSGEYPRVLDGLCKSLSYDMRVIDPAWIGAKLRQLVDFPEPRGDFLAWVPGEHRKANFPSTVAYLARLMIHRYAMLGILDEDGYPMEEMGIVAYDAENVIPLRARSVGAMEVKPGKRCGECGNYAVILKDGCDFCTACGAVGGCG
jgi:ribonucleoside-diphosphate reductase alpha chain